MAETVVFQVRRSLNMRNCTTHAARLRAVSLWRISCVFGAHTTDAAERSSCRRHFRGHALTLLVVAVSLIGIINARRKGMHCRRRRLMGAQRDK